jgi:methylmalonyl-CoA mutase cobalamin-binding subunit
MAKANRRDADSFQFTLILAGIKDLTPDVTDALYEAGFDDALVGMAAGIPYIDVNNRQAESLDKAVREAIRDVEKAGFHVVRVESDAANAIARISADLLTLSSHS